jgi:hypothetical protein
VKKESVKKNLLIKHIYKNNGKKYYVLFNAIQTLKDKNKFFVNKIFLEKKVL